jgi:hypothetical protein
MAGAKLLVASDLIDSFASKCGVAKAVEADESLPKTMKVEAVFKGKDIAGTKYEHPLYPRHHTVIEGGDYITTESGDINAFPSGTYTATKITVYTNIQNITGGSSDYTYKIAYRPTNSNSPTFDANNMVEAPWIDIGLFEIVLPVVAFGLTANTTYYFIMYVSDSTATELAPVFTTPLLKQTAQAAAPTVTTTSVELNANGYVKLIGTITGIGSSPIAIYGCGMCYSISDPPTIYDFFTTNNDTGPNIVVEHNPTAGFTYYVRAYATNEDALTGYSSTSTVVVPAPQS